ncbi:unnamed protein product [Bursaphelenchus xylophilus]|uniref:(pine wood nematode) hypothetical protein n=1 Tax=Bursaphelenchus xylophilus TaxID=6326 RepID=A0A7I8X3J8_BURXY|nr:unnamed protein product [Bursaphelenchus xylophilus]CAG9128420.1 unnamed protein product [Bursaphelenchus xylophilus]
MFLRGEWVESPWPEHKPSSLKKEIEVLNGSEPLWIQAKLGRTGNRGDAAIFCIMLSFSRDFNNKLFTFNRKVINKKGNKNSSR